MVFIYIVEMQDVMLERPDVFFSCLTSPCSCGFYVCLAVTGVCKAALAPISYLN